VWSPLAGGLLSGKYRRGKEAPEGSRHLTEWSEPPVRDGSSTTIEKLLEIADGHGVSAAQVALPVVGRPAVASLIIGARKDEQLEDNLAARAGAVGRGAQGTGRGQCAELIYHSGISKDCA